MPDLENVPAPKYDETLKVGDWVFSSATDKDTIYVIDHILERPPINCGNRTYNSAPIVRMKVVINSKQKYAPGVYTKVCISYLHRVTGQKIFQKIQAYKERWLEVSDLLEKHLATTSQNVSNTVQ